MSLFKKNLSWFILLLAIAASILAVLLVYLNYDQCFTPRIQKGAYVPSLFYCGGSWNHIYLGSIVLGILAIIAISLWVIWILYLKKFIK